MLSILSLTMIFTFFFFNDTATTEIYTLSLHDALPICPLRAAGPCAGRDRAAAGRRRLDASGDDRGGDQGLRARRGRSGARRPPHRPRGEPGPGGAREDRHARRRGRGGGPDLAPAAPQR